MREPARLNVVFAMIDLLNSRALDGLTAHIAARTIRTLRTDILLPDGSRCRRPLGELLEMPPAPAGEPSLN